MSSFAGCRMFFFQSRAVCLAEMKKARHCECPALYCQRQTINLLCGWSDYFGTSKAFDIAAQILDGVIQELHDILRIMGERARILDGILVVIGGLQQARSKGVVTD